MNWPVEAERPTLLAGALGKLDPLVDLLAAAADLLDLTVSPALDPTSFPVEAAFVVALTFAVVELAVFLVVAMLWAKPQWF